MTDSQVRIDATPPAGEEGRVAQQLAPFDAMFGRAPDALRLMGVSPPMLENYVAGLGYFLNHPTLSQPLLAMVRYLVSATGGCRYCIDLNAVMLTQAGFDLETITAAVDDIDRAPFEPRERALIATVVKAVNEPHGVSNSELKRLRGHGWSDRDLFDALWHGFGNRSIGNLFETLNLQTDGTL